MSNSTTARSLDIIDDPGRARTALHPLRLQLLRVLEQPKSAPQLAATLDLPRQQINYHLRRLEADRLVEAEEMGRVGRRIDRQYRRTAASYLIAPATLAGAAVDPRAMADRFSSAFLAAASAKTLSDLAALRRAAERESKRVPSLALEAEVRFATPSAQRAFADALTQAFGDLVARFHNPAAREGRTFRIFAGGYPAVADREKDVEHV
jgi:DNA-binding transcriptional ArsR family regulator